MYEIIIIGLLVINIVLTILSITTTIINSGDKCNYPNCALVEFYKNRKSIDDLPSLKKEDVNAKL